MSKQELIELIIQEYGLDELETEDEREVAEYDSFRTE